MKKLMILVTLTLSFSAHAQMTVPEVDKEAQQKCYGTIKGIEYTLVVEQPNDKGVTIASLQLTENPLEEGLMTCQLKKDDAKIRICKGEGVGARIEPTPHGDFATIYIGEEIEGMGQGTLDCRPR